MNHTFVSSLTDATLCRQCKRIEIDHTDQATCESCGKVDECEIIEVPNLKEGILACKDCKTRDAEINAEVAALGNTREERIMTVKEMIEKNSQIEQSIQILPDVFNAKTIAIMELKKVIDADNSIENKNFRLAEILDERYVHLKSTIFDTRKTLQELENELRAVQQTYNELGKTLRADEREKLRIKDVTYQPQEPKTIKKPRAPKVGGVNSSESREYIAKIELQYPQIKGQAAGLLRMTAMSKSVDMQKAYELLKESLAKSFPAS